MQGISSEVSVNIYFSDYMIQDIVSLIYMIDVVLTNSQFTD